MVGSTSVGFADSEYEHEHVQNYRRRGARSRFYRYGNPENFNEFISTVPRVNDTRQARLDVRAGKGRLRCLLYTISSESFLQDITSIRMAHPQMATVRVCIELQSARADKGTPFIFAEVSTSSTPDSNEHFLSLLCPRGCLSDPALKISTLSLLKPSLSLIEGKYMMHI